MSMSPNPSVSTGMHSRKSAASRRFKAATEQALAELLARDLSALDIVVSR